MRAAIYHGAGRLSIEDAPDPIAGDGEIVIRTRACGICGTDLMQWYQDTKAPVVLGHEPVGDVVAVGEGAPFEVGDRVFVHHHVPCLECELCLSGRDTLCDLFRATRIDPGGLAEFIRVPAENVDLDVHVLPKGMSPAAADARVDEVAAQVGLPPELLSRFPHQLSGGQKARVGIARALAPSPQLLKPLPV